MVKIVPTHPELVAEYQDMILSSVNDEDVSIRMRALDLVSAMVCFASSSVQILPTVALTTHPVRSADTTCKTFYNSSCHILSRQNLRFPPHQKPCLNLQRPPRLP